MKVVSRKELMVGSTCMVAGLIILFGELAAARATASAAAEDEFLLAAVAAIQPLPDVEDEDEVEVQIQETDTAKPVSAAKSSHSKSEFLVDAIVQIESAGQPRMVGRAGERGLMQIKRGTWMDMTRSLYGRTVGFDQAFNPQLNRQVGRAYLAHLRSFLQEHRAQWKTDERSLLLACYNAGPNRVKQAGFKLQGLPAQTQDYVERASALHDYYLRTGGGGWQLAEDARKVRSS